MAIKPLSFATGLIGLLVITACDLPQVDDTPASMDVPPTASEVNGATPPLLCQMDVREAWTAPPNAKGEVSLRESTLYAYTDGEFTVSADENANLLIGTGDPGTVFVFTEQAEGTVSVNINETGESSIRVLSSPGGEPYCEVPKEGVE